jgi:hypothetical protein
MMRGLQPAKQGQGNVHVDATRQMVPIGQAAFDGRNHVQVLNRLNQPPRVLGDAKRVFEKTVVIDSRYRADVIDTNENDYFIDLGREFSDVTTIELLEAAIPKSRDIIRTNDNDLIHFGENGAGGAVLSAPIPQGDYTGAQLAAEIQTQMNAVGASVYTVTVAGTATNPGVANRIRIASNGAGGGGTFDLFFLDATVGNQTSPFVTYNRNAGTRNLFRARSIGREIGFTAANQSGALTYTGANKFDLSGDKFVALEIIPNGNNTGMADVSSNAPGFKGMYAVLSLEGDQNTFIWHKTNQDSQIIHHMDHKKLIGFHIRWWSDARVAYDFRGVQHCLKFKLTMEPR